MTEGSEAIHSRTDLTVTRRRGLLIRFKFREEVVFALAEKASGFLIKNERLRLVGDYRESDRARVSAGCRECWNGVRYVVVDGVSRDACCERVSHCVG